MSLDLCPNQTLWWCQSTLWFYIFYLHHNLTTRFWPCLVIEEVSQFFVFSQSINCELLPLDELGELDRRRVGWSKGLITFPCLYDGMCEGGWKGDLVHGVSSTWVERRLFSWFTAWWNISTMQHNTTRLLAIQLTVPVLRSCNKWKWYNYQSSIITSDTWLHCELLSLLASPENGLSQDQHSNNS